MPIEYGSSPELHPAESSRRGRPGAADRRDESRRIVLRYHRDYTAGGEDDRVVVPADADRGDWADDRGDDDDQ